MTDRHLKLVVHNHGVITGDCPNCYGQGPGCGPGCVNGSVEIRLTREDVARWLWVTDGLPADEWDTQPGPPDRQDWLTAADEMLNLIRTTPQPRLRGPHHARVDRAKRRDQNRRR